MATLEGGEIGRRSDVERGVGQVSEYSYAGVNTQFGRLLKTDYSICRFESCPSNQNRIV
jgi:hypothetical protein